MDNPIIERATVEWLEMLGNGAYVSGKYDDVESWIAARSGSIGSSEAAAVMGMSPYMNETDLWESKREKSKKTIEENEDMARGHASEPLILSLYKTETGDEVKWGDKILLRSSSMKFMTATLDGIGIGKSDGLPYVIEVKSISRNRDEWTDETVPSHYYLQVLHQLSVTRFKRAVLLARFCRTEWGGDSVYERCYHFEYDKLENEIRSLEKVERKFWEEYVVNGTRPPVRVPEI